MNVERTIEFILDRQAQTESNLAAFSANHLKIEANLAELSANQKKTDRQIAAVAVLVQAGMKRLIRQEQAFNTRLNALTAAQQRTDARLDRLAKLLTEQRTNGHRHSS